MVKIDVWENGVIAPTPIPNPKSQIESATWHLFQDEASRIEIHLNPSTSQFF